MRDFGGPSPLFVLTILMEVSIIMPHTIIMFDNIKNDNTPLAFPIGYLVAPTADMWTKL